MTRKQKIFTSIFIVVGVAAMLFFGMRVMRSFRLMNGKGPFGKPPPAEQTDISLIRDWMTVPYVARSYKVPPEALFIALEIPGADGNGKKSLEELNEEFYPDREGIVLAHVQASIQAMQKQEPPPRFPATPIPTTIPAITSTPAP